MELFDGGDPVDRKTAAVVLANMLLKLDKFAEENRHMTKVQHNTNKLLQAIGKRKVL
jgi:hypothetical protein